MEAGSIDHGWKGILVYLQTDGQGRLLPVALELADKAGRLSKGTGGEVYGLVIVHDMRDFYKEIPGIGTLFVALGKEYGMFSNRIFGNAVIQCISHCRPSVVLFGATPEGKSIAPQAAVHFRTGLTADCTELHMDEEGKLLQTRPAFGGNVMADILTPVTRPQMATVRPGIVIPVRPAVREGYPVEILQVPGTLPGSSRVIRTEDQAGEKVPLEEAEFIVAAGGGIGDRRDVKRLWQWAGKNGAVLGCSRKLVERGWLPGECQIGLSGRSVAPKLLITVGVSGSVQFLAGIRRAEYVAAIDCCVDAPIFGRSNTGILADLNEVLAELEREVCHSDILDERELVALNTDERLK